MRQGRRVTLYQESSHARPDRASQAQSICPKVWPIAVDASMPVPQAETIRRTVCVFHTSPRIRVQGAGR